MESNKQIGIIYEKGKINVREFAGPWLYGKNIAYIPTTLSQVRVNNKRHLMLFPKYHTDEDDLLQDLHLDYISRYTVPGYKGTGKVELYNPELAHQETASRVVETVYQRYKRQLRKDSKFEQELKLNTINYWERPDRLPASYTELPRYVQPSDCFKPASRADLVLLFQQAFEAVKQQELWITDQESLISHLQVIGVKHYESRTGKIYLKVCPLCGYQKHKNRLLCHRKDNKWISCCVNNRCDYGTICGTKNQDQLERFLAASEVISIIYGNNLSF